MDERTKIWFEKIMGELNSYVEMTKQPREEFEAEHNLNTNSGRTYDYYAYRLGYTESCLSMLKAECDKYIEMTRKEEQHG